MDFPGVALITGAASGIGRATSILFAVEGCQKIVIADINRHGLDETKKLLEERNPSVECLAVEFNLRDELSVQSLFKKATSKFGRLDYCCNVAGIVLEGPTAEGLTSEWELQYEINLRGLFFCERAELQAMRMQEPLKSKDSKYPMRGSIVNISSQAGLSASPDLPAYAAFKHGVNGITISDAMKYGPDGIRINAVCPGAVETPINNGLKPRTAEELAEKLKRTVETTALRRISDPREIAQSVVWLSSSRASFVSGALLPVNGGRAS